MTKKRVLPDRIKLYPLTEDRCLELAATYGLSKDKRHQRLAQYYARVPACTAVYLGRPPRIVAYLVYKKNLAEFLEICDGVVYGVCSQKND